MSQIKSPNKLFVVTVITDQKNGVTFTKQVKVKASSLSVAEHRAIKRTGALGVKRNG